MVAEHTMSGWVPNPGGYEGTGRSVHDDIAVSVFWRGDSGGRNTTKRLSLTEAQAEELYRALGDHLDNATDD